ncbi:hypothetical protein DH2020_013117 [Rehmannia glutinosa]|uniref:DUF4378 domain-containing protein n=1 Tax=Rehmannia glutinosa TaxID=99300 RepID=A0ABR0X1A8_REHGL
MPDRQRVSTESSRASFSSSSRSSSFSSLDCNRATQLETSFDRAVDLRDLVKDSIYRDVQGLSIKAKTTEEDAVPITKYRDSQRQQSNSSDGSCGSRLDKKQSTPADLKESIRRLAKLQEVAPHHHEPKELLRSSSYHSKDSSSFPNSKDAPRFSYDGREINRTRFNSHDGLNSTLKLKDLPRLSLDSREGSMRSLSADSKSKIFSKPFQKDNGVFDGNIQNQQHTPVNHARPPSVVAKLMGLETLPNSISTSDTNTGSCRSYPDEDFVSVTSSFQTNPRKPIQLSSSSSNSLKDPSSPRWRNSDCSMKPLSRFPVEPAPWKQMKLASRSTRDPAKGLTTFPSVYSEIEKRLNDLEFTQSGKDLRALKQIMEAMQAKGLLENPLEGQGSNFTSHEDHEQKNISSTRSVDNQKPQSDRVYGSTKRKTVSAQNYESSIVIMKPAKLVVKSGIPAASVISLDGLSGLPNRKGLSNGRKSNDLIFKSSQRDNALKSVNMKNDRTIMTAQPSTRSQQMAKEGNAGRVKSSGSISPRMQQKKPEPEKRSRPPIPSDSSKSKRQPNKPQGESNSLGGKRRPKHPHSQQSDDKLSEVSVESRNLSSHEYEDSAQSNEIADVTNSERSGLVEKKSTLTLSEEESVESGFVPTEYSSPVSVLDDVVYKNDSPSPIKYVGKTLKVDVSMDNEMNSNATQQSSADSFVSNSNESGATSDINRKKLQKIGNLVQKLRRLNSSHDETRVDYIAALCENTNPDHRYISEILLTSGLLLRDLGSTLTDFQFHPSGHPINPDLFLVLEQRKASTLTKEECRTKKTIQFTTIEKFRRKLIFDTVNEILARKLELTGPDCDPWIRRLKLARTALNAQKLLRELCSEIEGLKNNNLKCISDEEDEGWKNILYKDVIYRSERWIDFDVEISGAVLDIERSIFKDLVDEIVVGE